MGTPPTVTVGGVLPEMLLGAAVTVTVAVGGVLLGAAVTVTVAVGGVLLGAAVTVTVAVGGVLLGAAVTVTVAVLAFCGGGGGTWRLTVGTEGLTVMLPALAPLAGRWPDGDDFGFCDSGD